MTGSLTAHYHKFFMETANTIREFWFGLNPDDTIVAQERSRLWWNKNPDVDAEIRNRFEIHVAKAANRQLDDWLETPHGRLALILLVDQFPRNIYRNTPQAFAFDSLARLWCKEGIENAAHQLLRPIERVFFYLPLEHSESLADQELSVMQIQALANSVEPNYQPTFESFISFATRHRDIIGRFGRFPHRNQILGRESSPAEIAFLQEPQSSF
jgi:uncharacterized protein (DUF924 family)